MYMKNQYLTINSKLKRQNQVRNVLVLHFAPPIISLARSRPFPLPISVCEGTSNATAHRGGARYPGVNNDDCGIGVAAVTGTRT